MSLMTGPKCEECTLDRAKFVPPQIPDYAQHPILFVGQAPGKVEVTTGIPFTGPAGRMLFRLMSDAGLNKKYANITNAVMCMPPGDRRPTPEELACCRPILADVIRRVRPKVIVALGLPALEALTIRGFAQPMEQLRGTVFKLNELFGHDCPVLVTYHPAFVMRQRQWIEIVVNDLRKAVAIARGDSVSVGDEWNPNMILNPSPTFLADWLGRSFDGATVVFDIETTGLNPFEDKILGIAYCYSGSEAVAITFDPDVKDERFEVVRRFQEDPHVRKCAQNASFDVSFLDMAGIRTEGIAWDTRCAETVLHPDLPKDLQSMRTLYTTIPPYKPTKREMAMISSMPEPRVLEMACWDVITTWAVMEEQRRMMGETELKLMNDLLIPLIEPLWRMQKVGVRVDVPLLAVIYKRELPKVVEIEHEFMSEVGINPASPAQICERFGLRNSTEELLKAEIRRLHPDAKWFEKILTYRKKRFVLDTVLRGVYDRLIGDRVHTSFLLEGTATGRLASRNPNLQNIPRWLRQIFIPDDPERYWFCEADFKQQELRVGALLAPEPTLLNELETGKSVYKTLHREIFGSPEGRDPFQVEREITQTKGVVFGTLYGRTARSIAMEFGVPVAVAERWQAICINRFPGLLEYKRRCERDALGKGYVQTPFGRKRYVTTLTQAYNTPIQSTSADVGLTALLRVYRAGFDLRLTVYDSLLVQLPKGDLEAVREFKKTCEQPIEQLGGYGFAVDVKVGKSWGEHDLEKLDLDNG